MLKKSILLCFLVFTSFILMSFNYQTFNLDYSNNTLYYGANSYKLKDDNYITLINDAGNNQEYLIVTVDIKLFFDSADENYYYFAGYINDEILTLRVSASKGKSIIDRCLCNKINKDDVNYFDYFLIRENYYELRKSKIISIQKTSVPYINPYTLEQMTSSDRYLDGYEPTKYDVIIDTKYEDPIVNIIPKDLFFTEGKYIYYGKEYIFAIHTTYEQHIDNVNYYASRVIVFDIDITEPNVSQNYNTAKMDSVSNMTKFQATNLFIDMPIMEVYVGVVNNNDRLQSDFHVDDSQDRVVIEQGAFAQAFNIDQSPYPIYANLENYSTYMTGSEKMIKYACYENAGYYLENIKEENTSNTDAMANFVADAIATVAADSFFALFGIPNGSDLLEFVSSVDELIRYYNSDKSPDEQKKRQDDVTSRLYSFFNTQAYDDPIHAFTLYLPNNINKMVKNKDYNYKYCISTSFTVCNEDEISESNYQDSRCEIDVAFKMSLYDASGNPLNYVLLGGINQDYYNNGTLNNNEYIYESKFDLYAQYTLKRYNNTNFVEQPRDKYDEPCWCFYKPASDSNSSQTIVLEIPDNLILNIYDMTGRLLNSSKNPYFNSNKVIFHYETGKYYFFKIEYIGFNTNTVYINSVSPITDFGNEYTYLNTKESVTIFELTNDYSQKTYEFFTNSYLDTKILVCDEKGTLKFYNDDGFYNPDDDPSDYNASLTYHLNRSEKIYILLYADMNSPYDKSVTFYKYLR